MRDNLDNFCVFGALFATLDEFWGPFSGNSGALGNFQSNDLIFGFLFGAIETFCLFFRKIQSFGEFSEQYSSFGGFLWKN